MNDKRVDSNQYHFLFILCDARIPRLEEYNNTAYSAQMLTMPDGFG
jgi:hypothetical protein